MRPATPRQGVPGAIAYGAAANALPEPLIADVTNMPNPFDSRKSGLGGQTAISYQLAQNANVTATLYDLFGYKVREWSIRPGDQGGRQGLNTLMWDGTNEAGQKVSKGGYIAQIVVETPTTVVTAARKIGVIH